MEKSQIFWLLMILWAIFGILAPGFIVETSPYRRWSYVPGGLLLFVLLWLIGSSPHVFGSMVK